MVVVGIPSSDFKAWSESSDAVLAALRSSPLGLSREESARRRAELGPNALRAQRPPSRLRTLARQAKGPLVLLLVIAAVVSAFTGDLIDAGIVLTIMLGTILLGASREYRAERMLLELRARVRSEITVRRPNGPEQTSTDELVPGDVIELGAGTLIPADARLLSAQDLFVTQAVLTGESFPIEKTTVVVAPTAPLAERSSLVLSGTSVRTGTGTAVITEIGAATHFGKLAERLRLRPPEAEFDRGLRHYGYVLMATMLVMVVVVLTANVLLGRPPLAMLVFALALAVGLSPELLPAILNVNLAAGAQIMAQHGVLVRRLSAIENLGSIDVLCTDKTGTLTEGVVSLEGAYGVDGQPSAEVLQVAAINAALQTGLANPLDAAILVATQPPPEVVKLAEIPYDFVRKRLSVVVRDGGGVRLLTKGAFQHLLEISSELPSGQPLGEVERAALSERFEAWSREGLRVLGVAQRSIEARPGYRREDEEGLRFLGFLCFSDRPKAGARQALEEMARLHVAVKVITGDARLVAEHVAQAVGIDVQQVLSGHDLDEMKDEALWHAAERTQLFVEVDPNQKERIILALKKTGHVVGVVGDGVNDAPAMHASDTSVSVDQATEVAKDAADFVLLERDLDVLRRGIEEGRKTFVNTQKYILTTTSANLGNMVSMAFASVVLPFLPLTAGQVLLNNLLSDIPAIGLAQDSVDPEAILRPRRWSMSLVLRFMIAFGLLSSLFDLLTFASLWFLFSAKVSLFQTGWFVESLLTELLIAMVVRTRRPFWKSRPSKLFAGLTAGVIVLTLASSYIPGSSRLGFTPLPLSVLALVVGISAAYVLTTELLKRRLLVRAADEAS